MKKIVLSIFVMLFFFTGINAQNIVKGVVTDSYSEKPLNGVLVTVISTTLNQETGADGVFVIKNIPNGSYILEIKLLGYETQNFPIELNEDTIDLGRIQLYEDITEDQDLSLITITDDELNDDASAADNISGLLQASKDLYLRTAAYEFSSSFFRIKGLDSENAKVLINGIDMNKLYSGRPQWSNWGGLNDVLRNQEFSNGLTPSAYTFGGVLGSTNMNVRASEQRTGTKVSYSSSNRSYAHRLMVSHSSGLSENGWAYTFAASRRSAIEGFVDGTSYNANSMFASVEKKFNEKHSINFTSITAFNRRGKSSPQTQEVFDLKGIAYNSYWGYQGGQMRNSRIKEVFEPILMLNHYWTLNDKTSINTNISYQFGRTGNSRIDNNGTRVDGTAVDGNGNPYIVNLGASNPDPTYYQKLPSYGLRQGYANIYGIQQNFLNDGQLNWSSLYNANLNSANGGNSSYVLYEDRNDDKQLTINSILAHEISENITVNGRLQYTQLKSENFAEVIDLLGGTGYLDADSFADTFNEKQNDLLNPLNVVGEGDKFKYNFDLNSSVIDGFVQSQFKYNKVDYYLAANISRTAHQREGLFQNGGFADNSLGKSEKLSFTNFGVKGGLTYKLTGRHLFDFNAGYLTKAPNLRNSFSNSRENNNTVDNLTSEKIISTDVSYIYRSPIVQAKLTGYYIDVQDATEISFFFADGIGGDNTAFVQEVLSGIDKKHFGAEFGIEAQVTPTIKLKAAGNFGQYTYNNNPNLYLTTENNTRSQDAGFVDGRKDFGEANLENYKLAAGPQTAYSLGFEYRDPDYWYVGATANFFDNTYVDIAPLTRTSNFADDGGIPFNDYDEEIARELLQQEKFGSYMVVNMIGGKSWKTGNQYISVFASIGNIFNTEYKSGGFEQGRNANYRELKADKELDTPVFGNKYWFGRGTNYFLNVSYSF
ncbi:TonB-dependent receptor [Polaribacter reichenbachii]|uniref:TonB-dependent receptor n=1 Tax=Polaribacter reichenbachii TaxID=996801 RepID=A0A1B8U6H6_9FLAO|nr:TonB-dependent receptor [Polaribacter reichenbachii]APZ46099.1 TonB-dependent receptor [Polaribacter reichenbachii]AUC19961.1 TonB-dependent receptor [Polaribacter reichenbachii]OBY67493.1 TonB-dependent receptor [Polaribacter reichenbachii]